MMCFWTEALLTVNKKGVAVLLLDFWFKVHYNALYKFLIT